MICLCDRPPSVVIRRASLQLLHSHTHSLPMCGGEGGEGDEHDMRSIASDEWSVLSQDERMAEFLGECMYDVSL